MQKKQTKIIATIGPSSLDTKILQGLIEEGIDFIRINTAYGDISQYDLILKNLKIAQKSKQIEVILDIKNNNILKYAFEKNINKIALSFVDDPSQIIEIKKQIPHVFIIAKIESEKGVINFDDILEISDGIMIARGDLGRAISLEKVPPLQQQFTLKTLKKNKFLITATEMLLSMVNHSEPSRAEISDVANAVFNYSSAVMLSEETAIGKYPIEAVKIMRKTIEEAEKYRQIKL